VIDPAALQMVLDVLTGWLARREREAIAYVIEENRLLRRQLGTRRLRLTDDDLCSARFQVPERGTRFPPMEEPHRSGPGMDASCSLPKATRCLPCRSRSAPRSAAVPRAAGACLGYAATD